MTYARYAQGFTQAERSYNTQLQIYISIFLLKRLGTTRPAFAPTGSITGFAPI